jgi:hypothetical protein
MSVTLQYEKDGEFKTTSLFSVQDAITQAIVWARDHPDVKPLRILNDNGAVVVAEAALATEIEKANRPPQLDKALIINRGTNHPYPVRVSRILNDGRVSAVVETPGNGQTPIIFDKATGVVTSAAWQGQRVENDPHRFDVDIPEDPAMAKTHEEREEAFLRSKKETDAMEASPLWGAW